MTVNLQTKYRTHKSEYFRKEKALVMNLDTMAVLLSINLLHMTVDFSRSNTYFLKVGKVRMMQQVLCFKKTSILNSTGNYCNEKFKINLRFCKLNVSSKGLKELTFLCNLHIKAVISIIVYSFQFTQTQSASLKRNFPSRRDFFAS